MPDTVMSDEDINSLVRKLGPAVVKALGQAGVKTRMPDATPLPPESSSPAKSGRSIARMLAEGMVEGLPGPDDDDGAASCPAVPPRPPKPLAPQVMHATADPEG